MAGTDLLPSLLEPARHADRPMSGNTLSQTDSLNTRREIFNKITRIAIQSTRLKQGEGQSTKLRGTATEQLDGQKEGGNQEQPSCTRSIEYRERNKVRIQIRLLGLGEKKQSNRGNYPMSQEHQFKNLTRLSYPAAQLGLLSNSKSSVKLCNYVNLAAICLYPSTRSGGHHQR
jgi:hypothetical protein